MFVVFILVRSLTLLFVTLCYVSALPPLRLYFHPASASRGGDFNFFASFLVAKELFPFDPYSMNEIFGPVLLVSVTEEGENASRCKQIDYTILDKIKQQCQKDFTEPKRPNKTTTQTSSTTSAVESTSESLESMSIELESESTANDASDAKVTAADIEDDDDAELQPAVEEEEKEHGDEKVSKPNGEGTGRICCSNPSCLKMELSGNDLKKCSRCRRVQYCSSECQLSHWKWKGDMSHKLGCDQDKRVKKTESAQS